VIDRRLAEWPSQDLLGLNYDSSCGGTVLPHELERTVNKRALSLSEFSPNVDSRWKQVEDCHALLENCHGLTLVHDNHTWKWYMESPCTPQGQGKLQLQPGPTAHCLLYQHLAIL